MDTALREKNNNVIEFSSESLPLSLADAISKDLYLCFADGGKMYFTNRKAIDVRGDDWNDAPLEHNASEPYLDEVESYAILDTRNGFENTRLLTYDEIADSKGIINTPFSVQNVNRRNDIAWAKIVRYSDYNDYLEQRFFPNDSLLHVLSVLTGYYIFCKLEISERGKEESILYNFKISNIF